ncbi:hypothetical protein BD414DRAFT_538500 [Trametes punicea]|nr:hypothetical protein BD414DRAFT_538500 [Trametes punicea]
MGVGSLFGVTTAQSVWYFKHYPKDRRVLKLLVATVWILDVVHLGLYAATMFIYLVQKKAAYFGQQPLPWTSNVQLLCNAFAIGFIQSYFLCIAYLDTGQKALLAVMITFIVATWAFSVVLFAKTIHTSTVTEYVLLIPLDIALSTMSASTDVLLCAALVILLSRSRTGTAGANRLINRLVLYSVHTGLLTSVNAVMSVIMVLAVPTSSLFVMFYYIGAQLYFVSLLATLNAREGLRIQAERMGHRSLPEIQVTVSAVPKQSLADAEVMASAFTLLCIGYLLITVFARTKHLDAVQAGLDNRWERVRQRRFSRALSR